MNMKYTRPVKEEASSEGDEAKELKETKYEDYFEDKTLNSMIPIWQKNKDEVTDEEHDQFYQSNSMTMRSRPCGSVPA